MSDTLPREMAAAVQAAGGLVTMARFMELALTHESEGYYARSHRVLGPRGDFSTAPSLCPVFNSAVARLVTELLDGALVAGAESGGGRPVVVELGAGEGHLAAAILAGWESARPELRPRVGYRMVEVGEGLRSRQEAAVRDAVRKGWDVRWGRTVEEVATGSVPVVMAGNEFFDALPVHLVDVSGPELQEVWVSCTPTLQERLLPASPEAVAELIRVFGAIEPAQLRGASRDGIIELRPAAGAFMKTAARAMPAGSMVVIDYGEWFESRPSKGVECGCGPAPALRARTIRGYRRHQKVSDPLAYAGRQDITADVDFGALALHASEAGFEMVAYTTVSALLRGAGTERELAALESQAITGGGDALEADRQAVVLRELLDPDGVGGVFKVLILVRDEGDGWARGGAGRPKKSA